MTQISTKKTVKSNISLRQLVDIDESDGSKLRYDNIKHGQVLVSYVKTQQPKTFSFKYLSSFVLAGTGISVTDNGDGTMTIDSTSSGDMSTSVYDTDLDGVVDSSEAVKIIVRNSTGVTLTKGQVVYLLGATGNRPNAVLADASTEATSSKTIGLVSADIPNNSDGNVTVSGTMHDLDLSAFAAGDRLWLNNVPGAMVATTPPAEPNHAVFIGTVARAHPTQGRIVLAIQNGYELDELHGVQITTPANNEVLTYESSTSLWKNKSIASTTIFVFNLNSYAVPNGSLFYGAYLGGTPVTPPNVTNQYGSAANQFHPGYPMPAGTASSLVVILRIAQVAPTSVMYVKIANTDTSTFGPVITIPAGSAAGTYTDNSATVSFTANQRLTVVLSNPFIAGATAGPQLTTGFFKYTI